MNNWNDAIGWEIIKDKRTLKALIKKGFIREPKHDFLPYVDFADTPMFFYMGYKYKMHYVSGNFYPFLKRFKI